MAKTNSLRPFSRSVSLALLFTGSFASVSATGASVWLSSEHGQFFDCPAICEQEGDNATFASMCTTAEFAEAVDALLDRSTFAWTGIFQWPTNPPDQFSPRDGWMHYDDRKS